VDGKGDTPEKEENMIVLNVTYKCKPDKRDEFLEMIYTEGIDTACREEDGNIRYDYYTPEDGSDELLLVEKWRDADALARHVKQPHYARLGELKNEFVSETIVEKYEA
jgi:quinol monooxygenase YgiN